MDENKDSNNKTPDPQKEGENEADNKKSPDTYKGLGDYLQWKRIRNLVHGFSEIAELKPFINAFDNAVKKPNFSEATKLVDKILKIVKETIGRSKDFDLDQILPAFLKR